jgi:hypothetical protein
VICISCHTSPQASAIRERRGRDAAKANLSRVILHDVVKDRAYRRKVGVTGRWCDERNGERIGGFGG